MTRLMLVIVLALALALFGCGEQGQPEPGPGDDGNGEVTGDDAGTGGETDGDGGGEADGDAGGDEEARPDDRDITGLAIESPRLEVGQWIEYGVDEMMETLTISVVDSEMKDGVECLWVQMSAEGFVAQILIDPTGLDTAMEGYQVQFNEFMADPAEFIRENMGDTGSMANMFSNEEGMQMALEFLRAIKTVKFEQNGMVTAIDMAGVADFVEEMAADPAFQEQFNQGFAQGFEGEGGPEAMADVLAELDRMEFEFGTTEMVTAGAPIEAVEFSVEHPDGGIEVALSGDLPIIPLAYAEAFSAEDNETHYVEVRGFGFEGAENMMPGEPDQTVPAMMFLQGMQSQMQGGMGAGQGAAPIR